MEITVTKADEPSQETNHPADKPGPTILYRYCSVKGENFDWFAQTMKEDRIWCTPPSEFNDPFECQCRILSVASKDEKIKILEFNLYKERSRTKRARAMLLTKAKVWTYEEEWRFLNIKDGPGLHSIPSRRVLSRESYWGPRWRMVTESA